MSVFAGNRKSHRDTPEALVDHTADIVAGAAERRLAAANEVLAELRTKFPTAVVVPAMQSTEGTRRGQATRAPEPVPSYLRRYAEEVDRWHLEARAARAARALVS